MTSTETHRLASHLDIDDAAASAFRERGFLAIDQFVDEDEIQQLGAAYDAIIDGRVSAAGDRHLGGLIRQVMAPSTANPLFANTVAIERGSDIARRVFDHADVTRTYEMLIDKPPGANHETPWHQDIGYFGRPVAPAGMPGDVPSLQFWLALDDVDQHNGCMEFAPSPYASTALAHVVAAGDPDDEGRLIELADSEQIEASTITPCPLRAGGCTVHFITTPHRTGPNVTADRRRRVFIFNIGPRSMAEFASTVRNNVWSS